MKFFALILSLTLITQAEAGKWKPSVGQKQKHHKSKTKGPSRGTVRVPKVYGYQSPRLEVKSSAWLASLGVAGQNGLYAAERIKKDQFIGWYEGKIYPSVRKFQERVPSLKYLKSRPEFSYSIDVSIPRSDLPASSAASEGDEDLEESVYLYTIDAFQPLPGSYGMCEVAFINHKPESVSNSKFYTTDRTSAPFGVTVAVFAKRAIAKGEEITIDYGGQFEDHFQKTTREYRKFVEEHAPEALVEIVPSAMDETVRSQTRSIFELLPSLIEEVDQPPLTLFDVLAFSASHLMIRPIPEIEVALRTNAEIIKHLLVRFDILSQGIDQFRNVEVSFAETEEITAVIDEMMGEHLDIQQKLEAFYPNFVPLTLVPGASVVKLPIEKMMYKNFLSLSILSWRKSLSWLATEYRVGGVPHWQLRMRALKMSQIYFSRATEIREAAGIPLSLAVVELGRLLNDSTHRSRMDLPLVNVDDLGPEANQFILDEISKDRSERYQDAQYYLEVGIMVIEEDKNPLKSIEDKKSDRNLAIRYFQHALSILGADSDGEDPKYKLLRAHLNWSLSESHRDEILNDAEKTRVYAQAALDYYRFLSRLPGYAEILEQDIQDTRLILDGR